MTNRSGRLRGKGAPESKREYRKKKSTAKQDWRELAEGLVLPRLLPSEEELKAFKEFWDVDRRLIEEVIWDKAEAEKYKKNKAEAEIHKKSEDCRPVLLRVYKPTGKRVAVGLTQKQKDRIDAEAEMYEDLDEYRLAVLPQGSRRLYLDEFPPDEEAYGDFEKLYRLHLTRMIDQIFDDPEMLPGSQFARKRISRLATATEHALQKWFSVRQGRGQPPKKDALHRKWSRMRYLGREWHEIADEAHKDDPKTVAETHVRTSVMRYRERREPLQWLLRYVIYHASDKT